MNKLNEYFKNNYEVKNFTHIPLPTNPIKLVTETINGKRFYIPTEVIGLIDSLWAQLGNTDPFPQSG